MSEVYIVSTIDNSTIKKSDSFKTKVAKVILQRIKDVSGSDYTHTQIVIDGSMYESRMPQGFHVTHGYKFIQRSNNLKQYPKKVFTDQETRAMKHWFTNRITENVPYGVFKLLAMLILAKTKPFWAKIGYVPFGNDWIWGDFCSSAVDNCLKVGNLDLIPVSEEFTTPGDIVKALNKK